MANRFAIFVDAGFLRAEGAKALGLAPNMCHLDAPAAVRTLEALAAEATGERMLRTYWYDGKFRDGDPRAPSQQRFLDAIALTPGLHLRLGTIKTVQPPWLHALGKALERNGLNAAELGIRLGPVDTQKGVDTLIVLDIVRLAQKGIYSTAVLLAGDRDLLDAMRVAQEEGVLVILAHPFRAGVDPELRRAADAEILISQESLRQFLVPRNGSGRNGGTPAQQPGGNQAPDDDEHPVGDHGDDEEGH